MQPYPLKFKAELKERVWGGRALARYGHDLPEGKIGEAWVIGDHPNGTTAVANGPLAGQGLDQIRTQYGKTWFGEEIAEAGRFPLLIKLLDCNDDLSVQVHPNDHYSALPKGEYGKTEMWYVLSAEPEARIIYGLKEGLTRDEVTEAIRGNRIMDTLNVVQVQAGDTFYIPAGTVHALGRVVVVAEIQQNSDTTYRLYDYDRPGLDGKPRELHIEDSLAVISYTNEGASHAKTDVAGTRQWLELARSAYFVVEKGELGAAEEWTLALPENGFAIHIVCEGRGVLQWEGGELPVEAGEALLLPATLGEYRLQSNEGLTLLRSYVPKT